MRKKLKWSTVECDPEIFNTYLKTSGVDTRLSFVEIYSFDENVINEITGKITGIILIYPLSETLTKYHDELLEKKIKKNLSLEGDVTPAWFMEQTVENACATVAFLHVVANTILSNPGLSIGSTLFPFYAYADELNAKERGVALGKNMTLTILHEIASIQGNIPDDEYDKNLPCINHYITFVEFSPWIIELDGRSKGIMGYRCHPNKSFVHNTLKLIQEHYFDVGKCGQGAIIALTINY